MQNPLLDAWLSVHLSVTLVLTPLNSENASIWNCCLIQINLRISKLRRWLICYDFFWKQFKFLFYNIYFIKYFSFFGSLDIPKVRMTENAENVFLLPFAGANSKPAQRDSVTVWQYTQALRNLVDEDDNKVFFLLFFS